MKDRFRGRTNSILSICVCLCVCFSFGLGSIAYGAGIRNQARLPSGVQKEKKAIMTSHANGTFEVKMIPQSPEDKATGATIGKFSLDKQFHGDLEGTSKGEMLAVSTAVEGSAGYVALEQVTGTLNGRPGTFALQHTGTMNRGAAQLSVTVVPDSGTGDLVGLAGKMDIKIADGKHYYDFEYTLAEKP
jgi:Protein of unknown function (DUF3224)